MGLGWEVTGAGLAPEQLWVSLCLPPSLEASYQGKMGPGSSRGDRPAPPTTNAKGECGPVRPDLPREAEHAACYVEISRV